ncbi:MAG: hypothetical protein RLZZ316_3141 [Bacteroidota bacterium]|jgi:predicted amidohydrolase YtcJ
MLLTFKTTVKMKHFKLLIFLGLVAVSTSCGDASKKADTTTADAIYFGGDIITMETDSAVYAEAVAIKDGKIIYVGTKAEAEKLKGDSTVMSDLMGKTLLPGFIDGHGHLFMAGFQALAADLLPPPDGKGINIPSLISIGKEWAAKNSAAINQTGWIIGTGYDDAQLKEKKHPTADDLDRVSVDTPVIFVHQSGHLCVMNHKGLQLSGYNAATPDPKGGIIRRKAGSKTPDGVLEETAMIGPIFKLMGSVDKKGNEKIVEAGMKAYSKYGYTTAQEGRASTAACENFKEMAAKNALFMDVYAYPDIQMEYDYMLKNGVQKEYNNHFRIAGVKLSADGSPQGKTAWLTKPYKVPPPGTRKNYNGYPAIPDTNELYNLVATAFKNNWQILTHCNGDASADVYIRAVRLATEKYGNNDRRSVMIHAQTVREDQLDSMKVLGIMPSFFTMHTFYWGDWHRDETLGKERAYRISPTQSALKRGMIFTDHHDAPVAYPEAIRILSCAVNRVSRSGDIIGADQRISPYVSLKSLTAWAAFQAFEENNKGTLTKGKLADFVILDRNPLKIDPMKLADLKVMTTIKEGKTIYSLQ